ncbi:hypothetical protein L218DRAFT_296817 [Marasmius fiardii PR-910]|nr:hypothetical protein L218DRAFT_296817 [Marasmius fiardii PR-910]
MLATRVDSAKPSAEDMQFRDFLSSFFSYLGISLCTLVISVAGILSMHPLSKPITDRVSFRVMIYALCATVIFLISVLPSSLSSEASCRIWAPIAVSTLHLTSFLFFSIGLNLQLVMIHKVDGTRMEKYYIGGSLFLASLLGIMTHLFGQLTYIPAQKECLVRDVWWQIGLQYFWYLAVLIGELVTFSSVLLYMWSFKVFDSGPGQDTTPIESGLSASHQYRKPLGPRQYRNVVLRIALYPFASLTTLGIVTFGTVCIMVARGITDQSDWKVLLALRLVCLARGTIYGIAAASDPAITQGLEVLYRHYVSRKSCSNVVGNSFLPPAAPNDPPSYELQESRSPRNRPATESSLPQPELPGSRNSITLPPIPNPALIPSLIDAHYRSGYSSVDGGNGHGIGDNILYSYSGFRQL